MLIGSAGSKFDQSLQPSVTGRTLAANRLSFFSLMQVLPLHSPYHVINTRTGSTCQTRGWLLQRTTTSVHRWIQFRSWIQTTANPSISLHQVYYPASTPKWKIFSITTFGLFCAIVIVDLIGIGLASGVASHPAWTAAIGVSTGALIIEALSPVGGFGKFCAVVLALGVISNAVMGTYSASIDAQVMGRWGQKVPRYIWVIILR